MFEILINELNKDKIKKEKFDKKLKENCFRNGFYKKYFNIQCKSTTVFFKTDDGDKREPLTPEEYDLYRVLLSIQKMNIKFKSITCLVPISPFNNYRRLKNVFYQLKDKRYIKLGKNLNDLQFIKYIK